MRIWSAHCLLSVALLGGGAAEGASPTEADKILTLENIFASDLFSESLPSDILWLPDGQAFLYRQRVEATDGLWRHDVRSGQVRRVVDWATVEAVLQAARPDYHPPDRDNVDSHPGSGREPSLSPTGDLYLGVARNDLFVIDLPSGQPRFITSTPSEERFPTFSPDGTQVAFTRAGDLYLVDVASGRERRLTDRGQNRHILNGEADWVYEEELKVTRSFWWSPSGDRILFMQYDVSPITLIPIPDDLDQIPTVEQQRYPQAGGANALVKLGILSIATGAIRWIDDTGSVDRYLARGGWLPDGSGAWYETLSRDQKRLELRIVDSASLVSRPIVIEEDKAWVNIFDGPLFTDARHLLWTSERDGFRHLYLYRWDGTLLRQLTKGAWQIDDVLGVNAAEKRVLFTANAQDPTERHVYSVRLDGTGLKQLLTARGTHNAILAPGGRHFIDTYSNLETPSRMDLLASDGSKLRTVCDGGALGLSRLTLTAPELGTLKADDGTVLHFSLLRPPDFDPGKKYPALVYVYGGPGTQMVTNSWPGSRGLFFQFLTRKGLIIFCLDNRGSSGRGHAFETAVYRRLGQLEVADQVTGVRFLKSLPYVDPARIGVYGGSYGGYMALMCMSKAAEHFRVGIAYAPVTDWKLYDSVYTERYMDRPEDNPDGYREGAPLHFAQEMTGKLLICHGTADNNVHLQNTLQIADRFIQAGKLFQLMLYPRVRHGIRMSKYRLPFHTLKAEFLEQNLIQGGPSAPGQQAPFGAGRP